jgi:hypothetical protein|tara:strand:+ start:331 stop:768 length:438 start_codon:yes stop_codon:yes gene_type:complete
MIGGGFARPFLVASLLILLASCVSTGIGGEAEQPKRDETWTTWRPQDQVIYASGCFTAGAMIAAVLAAEKGQMAPPAAAKKCFLIRQPIGAMLTEYVDGPYDLDGAGSIWEAVDITGDIVYIMLDDTTGPHPQLHKGAVLGVNTF